MLIDIWDVECQQEGFHFEIVAEIKIYSKSIE
jgi:hypothetical protein